MEQELFMISYLPYAFGWFGGAAAACAITPRISTSSSPLTTSGLIIALAVVNTVFIKIIKQQKWSEDKKYTCINMSLLITPWSFASLANHTSLQIPSLIKVYGIFYISSTISIISGVAIRMTLNSVLGISNTEPYNDDSD